MNSISKVVILRRSSPKNLCFKAKQRSFASLRMTIPVLNTSLSILEADFIGQPPYLIGTVVAGDINPLVQVSEPIPMDLKRLADGKLEPYGPRGSRDIQGLVNIRTERSRIQVSGIIGQGGRCSGIKGIFASGRLGLLESTRKDQTVKKRNPWKRTGVQADNKGINRESAHTQTQVVVLMLVVP